MAPRAPLTTAAARPGRSCSRRTRSSKASRSAAPGDCCRSDPTPERVPAPAKGNAQPPRSMRRHAARRVMSRSPIIVLPQADSGSHPLLAVTATGPDGSSICRCIFSGGGEGRDRGTSRIICERASPRTPDLSPRTSPRAARDARPTTVGERPRTLAEARRGSTWPAPG